MYCSNCGKDIGDSAYCYNCGAKAEVYDDERPEINDEDDYLYDDEAEDIYEPEENSRYYQPAETKPNKNNTKIITVSVICIALLIVVIIIACKPVMNSMENKKAYNTAVELYESGNYEAALEIFNSLGDYKDVSQRIALCNEAVYQNDLNSAIEAYNSGNYTTAITLLNDLASSGNNNAEVQEWIGKCCEGVYQYATEQYNNENFAEANKYFAMISGYRDADDMAAEAQKGSSYLSAVALYNAESYDEAYDIFETLEGYMDADTYATNCQVMIMRAKWKPAFINYIKSDTNSKHRYAFTYIDINSTPELYVKSTDLNEPDKLCVFNYYGEIDEYSLSKIGNLAHDNGISPDIHYASNASYVKASGVLALRDNTADMIVVQYYLLSDLKLTEYHSGRTIYTGEIDSNGDVIYECRWDGKDVSENEYNAKVKAMYGSSNFKETTVDASYTASEMINYINANF